MGLPYQSPKKFADWSHLAPLDLYVKTPAEVLAHVILDEWLEEVRTSF